MGWPPGRGSHTKALTKCRRHIKLNPLVKIVLFWIYCTLPSSVQLSINQDLGQVINDDEYMLTTNIIYTETQRSSEWLPYSRHWRRWSLPSATPYAGLIDSTLRRDNERHGVSNHQLHDCLLNCLFRHRSKKTSKLRVTGLCAGNSPVTGEFPTRVASNAENISIWWLHHVCVPHSSHISIITQQCSREVGNPLVTLLLAGSSSHSNITLCITYMGVWGSSGQLHCFIDSGPVPGCGVCGSIIYNTLHDCIT